jgi:hypothetical protein
MKNIIKINLIFIFIFLVFSVNLANSDILITEDYIINDDQELFDLSKNFNDFKYRLFYIGRIKDLNRQENFISFDSINLYRLSFIRSNDMSFWEYSITHYENTYHQHENYRFIGILTNSIIFGFLFK